MAKKVTGLALLERVFEEEIESIWDIEEYEGVTDFNDAIMYNEGWYNYHKVTFDKDGKTYSINYKSHTSDNVCDEEVDYDSFEEGPTVKYFTVSTVKDAEEVHRFLQQALQNGSSISITTSKS